MTEIGEMIALPVVHTEPSEDCPFCPLPENLTYTTYPGVKNNSKKLASIMENPEKLTSAQSGSRPQTAKADADGYTQEQENLIIENRIRLSLIHFRPTILLAETRHLKAVQWKTGFLKVTVMKKILDTP